MKYICGILILLIFNAPLFAQYYLRGEIKDEAGKPLPNAKIILHSTNYIYYSGNSGGFGILSSKLYDSVTVSMDGFSPSSPASKQQVRASYLEVNGCFG